MNQTKKLLEHLTNPKIVKTFSEKPENEIENLQELVLVVDDFSFTSIFFLKDKTIHAYATGERDYIGVLDACLYIYQLNFSNKEFRLSKRELASYLSDGPQTSVFDEGEYLFDLFFSKLSDCIEALYNTSIAPYDSLSTSEKITNIETVIDEFFNVKFHQEGKSAHLLEVDGVDVVVKISGSQGCSVGKDLEFLQNLLQDKLKCYDINVIPEY